MLYIAMKAGACGDGALIHAEEISEAQAIPPHYLKQILSRLRAAGLIRSTRGPAGGHGLARPAEEISVGEIIQCLEGSLTCVQGILDMPCAIHVGPSHCVIKEFLLDVKARTESLLNGTSLADLAARQTTLSQQKIVVETRLMKRPLPA